ncbi:MAG: hypothetical protein ORN98_09250, partial [Alphaproteobacteria bacterium]|nr:hypothetical protein [Alphaproteobacteria bacterium]
MGKTGPDTPPPRAGVGLGRPADQTEYYSYKVPSTGEIVQLPKGVQYGFNYAPGKSAFETALAARMPRLEKLAVSDNAVARLNINQLINSDTFERWVKFAANGKMADSEYPIAINGDGKLVVLRAGDVANHGENINAQIWAGLQDIIDKGDNIYS